MIPKGMPEGINNGSRGDQNGTRWDQNGTRWDQNGTLWNVGLKLVGANSYLDDKEHARRSAWLQLRAGVSSALDLA